MAFADKLAGGLRAFPAGDRSLVGVSGGRDSVALLHELTAAGYRRLVVCHLDHGLRGRAAREDARFVERLAVKLGVPVDVGRVDVPALAKAGKLSLETAAREARYQFFAEAARRHRCRTVFLAHHADDQVETFLFNLLRGAGPAGLAAMKTESERIVGRLKLRIVRPMLSIWRTEIDEYVRAQGLKWREDLTNADPAHATRNRLRVEVLPLLEKAMGREVKPALWRTADILGAEGEWLDQLLAKTRPLPAKLSVEFVRNQTRGEQRRTVRAWLQERGATGIGYREVDLVLTLLNTDAAPAKINLPGNKHVRRRTKELFIVQSPVRAARRPQDTDEKSILRSQSLPEPSKKSPASQSNVRAQNKPG